jgi:hypothetical protein
MAAAAAMTEAGLWLPGVNTSNRKHDPPLSRGATPLVERCMRVFGWGDGFTRRCLKGYRQFMELKSVMNDWTETKLAAPLAVHQMWEQHVLDNLNYTDDCFLLFGRVIGHDPDSIMNDRMLVDRVKTTKIAFQARYGGDLDPEVWDFGTPEDDNMAIDAEDFKGNLSPSTPRGRLPVSSIDRHTRADRVMSAGNSISPRNNRPSLVTSSDEEQSPMPDATRTSGRSRSPVRRSTLTTGTTATAKGPRSPKSPQGNDPITIFLRDQTSGEETYFSLRYRSTLRIVFTVFAERKGLNQETLKFSFNGQALTGYETPYSLGLEDRARIDVLIGPRRA